MLPNGDKPLDIQYHVKIGEFHHIEIVNHSAVAHI